MHLLCTGKPHTCNLPGQELTCLPNFGINEEGTLLLVSYILWTRQRFKWLALGILVSGPVVACHLRLVGVCWLGLCLGVIVCCTSLGIIICMSANTIVAGLGSSAF